MRAIVVPYHHAEPLPQLADAFRDVTARAGYDAADAVIVSKGPAGAMVARLYDGVAARVAANGEPAIVASGDCTTSLGIVAGLQRRGVSPGVIWIDAHGDFHTPHTTRSGYLGGMALALLTGRAGASLANAIGLRSIAEDACLLAGARDLDVAEREALDASAVRRIDDVGALAHCVLPAQPWYVHLDVDVVDPGELAALRFPAPGGPSIAAVATALATLAGRGRVAAIGLACTFMPAAFQQPVALSSIEPLIAALQRLR